MSTDTMYLCKKNQVDNRFSFFQYIYYVIDKFTKNYFNKRASRVVSLSLFLSDQKGTLHITF